MPGTQGKLKLEEVQAAHRKTIKPRKTFLDSQQEALSLAAVIVDAEEEKSSKKNERIKATKHRPSLPVKTRSRLEERKEVLGAHVKRVKRNRTKSRKARMNASTQDNKRQVRKSVTFA